MSYFYLQKSSITVGIWSNLQLFSLFFYQNQYLYLHFFVLMGLDTCEYRLFEKNHEYYTCHTCILVELVQHPILCNLCFSLHIGLILIHLALVG
jgi:hypothetical protein